LQQIQDLYLEVLEHAPSERDTFLAEVCRGDDDLKAQLYSLLARKNESDSEPIGRNAVSPCSRAAGVTLSRIEPAIAHAQVRKHLRVLKKLEITVVNKAGRIWGEAVTEKVVWHVVRQFCKQSGNPEKWHPMI